ncbi:hypothetical protein R1flu_023770 [Riccia fluitans]|uniref:PPIase cyclophilin-type domain-containing protein n=1 Tax=Riccia fluitans TaxID=41844 RepID=A0ABD1XTT6_9MARC
MAFCVMKCPSALGLLGAPAAAGRSARAEQSSEERVIVHTNHKNGTGSKKTKTVSNSNKPSSISPPSTYLRREIFYLGAALMGSAVVAPEVRADGMADDSQTTRAAIQSEPKAVDKVTLVEKVDTTITDRVYLDVSLCPSASRNNDRTLGNTSQICSVADAEPLGRIVIGLYGKQVPQTVSNFKAMCTGQAGTSYAGTIFHRVLAGQYIQAGRQGSKDRGEVTGPIKLKRNEETVSGKAYKLDHRRPGTVSLCLSENDDEEELKLDVDYRNVQFLITTGPGPAPQLDNGNIVFGTVLEGMDVVASIAQIPTYKPSERIRQFNGFAEFLGDDRAANARNFWNRPLKSVVITKCGELPMGLPVFPPGLP